MIKYTLLSDSLDEYIKKNSKDIYFIRRYWPVISGPSLSAVTEVYRFKDNVLSIKTTSSSAKALLALEKNRILKEYKEKLPNIEIKAVVITKRA